MAMIQVEGLSKAYGPTLAVNDVSFAVEPGELVGFLGKNGAGKTTTMRILAGSLGATEGTARIAGMDVERSARKVKALVGYLPEVPPLYPDMTARAYLRFAARIKGVDKPRDAVDRAIEQAGLGSVAGRVIAHLSKGFRQRVGIAQAIVHDPKVLILDEPLSGLDPAQRKEIRDLVAALAAGDTTILLSTHVLPEIEAICDRVIMLHEGRLVAEDTIAGLAATTRRVLVRVARPSDGVRGAIEALEGVAGVDDEGGGLWVVHTDDDVREDVARLAVGAGLLELRARDNLEDAFLRITAASDAAGEAS